VSGQIDEPAADLGDDRGALTGRLVAAQGGAEPGEQLAHRERLGHVVVGAGVERADLVAGAGPPGQHDDRRPGPPAERGDHLGAVHVGQAKVEDHRVRRGGGRDRQGLPAGPRGHHLILPGPEVDLQGAQQLHLVLDDEDAGHGPSGRPGELRLAGRRD
jgi:hypothetical protein